jgi:hypothetical protein
MKQFLKYKRQDRLRFCLFCCTLFEELYEPDFRAKIKLPLRRTLGTFSQASSPVRDNALNDIASSSLRDDAKRGVLYGKKCAKKYISISKSYSFFAN